MDISELQKRLWEWQTEQFAPIEPALLALGVFEETGELAHCLLKRAQKIREGVDEDGMKKKIRDAVGDISIYWLNLASRYGVSMSNKVLDPPELPGPVGFVGIAMAAGDLLWRASTSNNEITDAVRYEMAMLMACLSTFCVAESIPLLETIHEVAEEVMKRDWKNNPAGVGI